MRMKEPLLKGILHGVGFSISVLAIGLAYASVNHPNLSGVSANSPLSASAWNDLVSYANKAVKQDTETLTVSGGKVGIGTNNPNGFFHVHSGANVNQWITTDGNSSVLWFGANYAGSV